MTELKGSTVGLFSKFLRHDGKAQQLEPVERQPIQPPTVTIYTTGWCASCAMAKRYLRQMGITYEEIDIESVPGAAEVVMNVARGYKTVPTVIVGETVVVDWDRRALKNALVAEGLLSG
jgi:mycoredoxin